MKTQHRKLIAAVSLCAAIVVPSISSAASISGQGTWETTLQARYLGNSTTINAYYDTSLNITWLANANYAGTTMNWSTANNWAANLNLYGITGWRLPTVTDTGTPGCNLAYTGTDCGYNVNTATGEMAHMFYTTLGDKGYYNTLGVAQADYGLTNTGPFSNVQSDNDYWSATELAPDTNYAWNFSFRFGGQSNSVKFGSYYAWAVHTGDVSNVAPSSTVPVPAAAWLFSSGLLGLVSVSGKRLRC